MIKYHILYLIAFLLVACNIEDATKSKSFNLDFEKVDSLDHPFGWTFRSYPFHYNNNYVVSIDRKCKFSGANSVRIINEDSQATNEMASYTIPAIYKGSKITLSGYLKNEQSGNNYSCLFLKTSTSSGVILNLNNMPDNRIYGCNEWLKYTIDVNYDPESVDSITFGAYMKGGGKLWIDNFQLQIDSNNLGVAPKKNIIKYPADLDTAFSNKSGIVFENLDSAGIHRLANLGILWGFLKYYHPDIAKGNYNWDAELFRIMPSYMAASGNVKADSILANWIDKLAPLPAANTSTNTYKKISYEYILKRPNFNSIVTEKIKAVLTSYKKPGFHYYLKSNKLVGNPIFTNEHQYNLNTYPDEGIRLLAAFRYWNMIQYFYPYRDDDDQRRISLLHRLISLFVNAKNSSEYILAIYYMISEIKDGHASLDERLETVIETKGKYVLPIQTAFIENKLVVTGFYPISSPVLKKSISIGDIIEKIDNKSIHQMLIEYSTITPASNFESLLNNLASDYGFLLRGNNETTSLTIVHNSQRKRINAQKVPIEQILFRDLLTLTAHPAYELLPQNIGYVYPQPFKKHI